MKKILTVALLACSMSSCLSEEDLLPPVMNSVYGDAYLTASGEEFLKKELASCTSELCIGAPLDLNQTTSLKATFVSQIDKKECKYVIAVKQCNRTDFILVLRGSYGEHLIDSMINVINPECKLIH